MFLLRFSRLIVSTIFFAGALQTASALDTEGDATIFHGTVNHEAHTLRELRGQPAVVNFWATWCGPCKEEMPHLQKLADEYSARGVRFVAVSLDGLDTQAKIPDMVAKRGFRIPVWTGATEQTLSALKLGELVPATLILDAEGAPIGKIEGEAREKDIRSRLDWLLNGRTGSQPKLVQKNDW